jgi:hypothetical protein
MGLKGDPDTKTNWSTDRRPQDELQLQHRNLFGICIRQTHDVITEYEDCRRYVRQKNL